MSAVIDRGGLTGGEARPRATTSVEPVMPAVALPKLSASERLEATRSQLRSAMLANARPAASPAGGSQRGAQSFIASLRALPGASLVVDTVLQWWARHPLHDASVIAREASGAIFRPIARDNPMKLIFGALLFGALLVILKPWRFILRSAIFAGLVPQFAAMALRRLPLSTWIGMFANRAKPRRRQEAALRQTEAVRRAA